MKSIPRLRFAHLPTPIEPLPRLSAVLGGPTLLAKRDDQTGLAMGGNKTRKLEFLLAEAQANGARTLVTAGAVQSNHCRQTAAAAARYGFECILVLYDTVVAGPEHQQSGAPVAGQATAGEMTSRGQSLSGNLLLDHLFGAQIVLAQREERDRVLQDTFQAAWEAGKRPYLIPYGGSNPTGATAYTYALKELMEQDVHSDWIVLASSSGGTQAGLVLGARIFGYKGKIVGISIDEESRVLQERVASLASMTADYLAENLSFVPDDILVNADYLGAGYGVLGEVEKEAIELFARSEGLLLDPVYTARAAAGLMDLIRRGFFSSRETVLFWHSGGTPALFAAHYQSALLER